MIFERVKTDAYSADGASGVVAQRESDAWGPFGGFQVLSSLKLTSS